MITIALIFLGGGIGSVLRFGVQESLYLLFNNAFPFGTLLVNVLGSLLIGFVLVKASTGNYYLLHPMLVTGFCGGFTTFSAFSYESFNLLKSTQYGLFVTYILLSLVLCLFGVAAGCFLAR